MDRKINIEDIKDIEIDGMCIKNTHSICTHDVILIYHNGLIKSTLLDHSDIKYVLDYLYKKHIHFN